MYTCIWISASSLEMTVMISVYCLFNYLNETGNKYINTEYIYTYHLNVNFVYMLPYANTLVYHILQTKRK